MEDSRQGLRTESRAATEPSGLAGSGLASVGVLFGPGPLAGERGVVLLCSRGIGRALRSRESRSTKTATNAEGEASIEAQDKSDRSESSRGPQRRPLNDRCFSRYNAPTMYLTLFVGKYRPMYRQLRLIKHQCPNVKSKVAVRNLRHLPPRGWFGLGSTPQASPCAVRLWCPGRRASRPLSVRP
jgi:hypothetical protein